MALLYHCALTGRHIGGAGRDSGAASGFPQAHVPLVACPPALNEPSHPRPNSASTAPA